MSRHVTKKGLDLPIVGEPEQVVEATSQPPHVALLASDYIGMKPTMHVQAGDHVKRGQLLFEDKKTPGVRYTAPAGGEVVAVNRGERRAFQSVVIALNDAERAGEDDSIDFESYDRRPVADLDREAVKRLLLESGLWTSLRKRPFSRVADPAETPAAIFITASDTNPLAASPDVALAGREDSFKAGVEALAKLTDGAVYVCRGPQSKIGAGLNGKASIEEFEGPHPSGAAGLHIHTLAPVSRRRMVWHANYQDVAAIGALFETGKLDVERVISIAGPAITRPRLARTRIGASIDFLVDGELTAGEIRVISGSVLSGRAAEGAVLGYLGRYHLQISAVEEYRQREILGWLGPGWNKFSVVNAFMSRLVPGQKFRFTTTTNGSHRAMVPIGMYEKVMPMDILPTFLLRALLMQDVERAEELGVLEFDEEDLGLCSFVCPGKVEYGPLLRRLLTTIEKEG